MIVVKAVSTARSSRALTLTRRDKVIVDGSLKTLIVTRVIGLKNYSREVSAARSAVGCA
jgi:hypothetical protein